MSLLLNKQQKRTTLPELAIVSPCSINWCISKIVFKVRLKPDSVLWFEKDEDA